MNDLTTSAPCPSCGGPALVSWTWREDPPSSRAVGQVCSSGCRLTADHLADRFPEMHDRRPY